MLNSVIEVLNQLVQYSKIECVLLGVIILIVSLKK